ncbi:MAG TPA: anti-anti-sigma factor [Myxococcales bacterium]|jgi:anti-anti-sigma factor|nr:anti-anti-sigma factor [Myxococcales bacterium]
MVLQRLSSQKGRGATLAQADVAIIRCEGEMGEYELAHIGEEIFRLGNKGYYKVVLDLAAVDHVDYRGLRPLASRARVLRSAGGDLKVSGLSNYLGAIFRAAGVEEEFELYRTTDEAKAAFAGIPVAAAALVKR